MQTIHKQKLQLLFSIDEMLTAYEDGERITEQNWSDMRDALSVLGLPTENVMFEFINDLHGEKKDVFPELKKYFGRFFDAQMTATANSAKVSGSYKDGKYACDREFTGYLKFLREKSVNSRD